MRQIILKQKENRNLISGPTVQLKVLEINGVEAHGVAYLGTGEHKLIVSQPFIDSFDHLLHWQLDVAFEGFGIFKRVSPTEVSALVIKGGDLGKLELRAFEPVLFRGIYNKENAKEPEPIPVVVEAVAMPIESTPVIVEAKEEFKPKLKKSKKK